MPSFPPKNIGAKCNIVRTWSRLKNKIKYHCNISQNLVSKCTRLHLSAYSFQKIFDALKPANSTVEASTLGEPFAESIILTNVEEQRVLRSWLPEAMAGGWRLLFRASRDGYAASVFHSKCDNKGPTVTVVKSRGNIFGGFTEESWTNQSGMFFIRFDVPIARHQLRVGFTKDFCIQSNLALRTPRYNERYHNTDCS